MSAEAKCSNCKHRRARNICSALHSPHRGRRVEATDGCEYFLENPAEEHFTNGIVASLSEDQPSREVDELEKAIALGLPEDTEMQAHYFLGIAYRKISAKAGFSLTEMVGTARFARALSEQEKALRIDRQGAYGYFERPLGRGLLQDFDSLCVLRSRSIASEQGPGLSIAFLEQQLRLCDYLSTSPLLKVLLELGNLYADRGEKVKSAACFEQIGHSAPVDRSDEDGQESETRAMAARNLRIVTGQSPTGHSSGSGCMLVVTVLSLLLVGAWGMGILP